jgi:hypothetical protein
MFSPKIDPMQISEIPKSSSVAIRYKYAVSGLIKPYGMLNWAKLSLPIVLVPLPPKNTIGCPVFVLLLIAVDNGTRS